MNIPIKRNSTVFPTLFALQQQCRKQFWCTCRVWIHSALKLGLNHPKLFATMSAAALRHSGLDLQQLNGATVVPHFFVRFSTAKAIKAILSYFHNPLREQQVTKSSQNTCNLWGNHTTVHKSIRGLKGLDSHHSFPLFCGRPKISCPVCWPNTGSHWMPQTLFYSLYTIFNKVKCSIEIRTYL